MDLQNHWLAKIIFAIFFSLTVSQVSAKDNITVISVDAGDDQVVNAGDKVHLKGVIEYTKNKKNGHKKGSDKYHYNKKSFKNNDNVVVKWIQDAGTTVDLKKSNRLKSKFYAPTSSVSGDLLVFTLTVSDADGNLLASDSVNITVMLPIATVSGRITTPDGNELADISIDILSSGTTLASETSGPNGGFSVDLAANSEVVLLLTGDGYADQVVPVRTPDTYGNIFLDITMLMRGFTQTFDADTDASLTGTDGASVSVTAGSFVDENGAPVTGDVELTITPVDISRSASVAAFPGEFSGVLEGEMDDSPIVSLGAAEYEFSQNGQPVHLETGQTADILIPIYIATYQDGTAIAVGDTIPLWSLNQDTGLWEQEGIGTVVASDYSPTGLAMVATVSHFSWWNCDVSMNAAQAIVTVFGPDTGTALIKARTNADIGWRPDTVDTVSAVGVPTAPLYIPSNGEVCFWAEISFDNGSNGTTLETCLIAAPNSTVSVDLIAPVAGPVNIYTIPAGASEDILDVTAYQGYPVDRVQLQPSTYETTVTYSIVAGALPPGLSLNIVNSVRAEITGTPTIAGNYTVQIQGTDADATTDTVTINYNVTLDVPPPLLADYIEVPYPDILPTIEDMSVHNTGGLAINWTLSYDPAQEQSPPPATLSLHPVTGILTISDSCIYWYGSIIASNASGSSEAYINVYDESCYGE